MNISEFVVKKESAKYGACKFRLNDISICFRVAKQTPKKLGQFVTLWKRTGNGPIQPFDIDDDIDFFAVVVKKDHCLGQFVFPKQVLLAKKILSKNSEGGKRAMRIYPPWEIEDLNSQAKKTQKWQLQYFLEIPL